MLSLRFATQTQPHQFGLELAPSWYKLENLIYIIISNFTDKYKILIYNKKTTLKGGFMYWSGQWDYFALLHSLRSSRCDRHTSVCLSLVVGPLLRGSLSHFNNKKTTLKGGFMYWSGQWDSDPRHQPWQGCALPLSYTRIALMDYLISHKK